MVRWRPERPVTPIRSSSRTSDTPPIEARPTRAAETRAANADRTRAAPIATSPSPAAVKSDRSRRSGAPPSVPPAAFHSCPHRPCPMTSSTIRALWSARAPQKGGVRETTGLSLAGADASRRLANHRRHEVDGKDKDGEKEGNDERLPEQSSRNPHRRRRDRHSVFP